MERFGSTPNKVKVGFQVFGLCIHAFADEVQVGKKSLQEERDNDVAFTRCMPTAEHGNLKFLGWWFESTHREISDDGRTEETCLMMKSNCMCQSSQEDTKNRIFGLEACVVR